MLKKEQLEKYLSLAMASAADFAELFEQDEVSETISMLNREVEDVNRVLTSGIGVRLYKGVQSVYGFTNEMTEEAIIPLIEDLKAAIGSAGGSDVGKCEEEKAPVVLTEKPVENRHKIKIDGGSAPLSEKTDLMLRAANAAFAVDEKIVKVQTSMLNVNEKVQISNSDGLLTQDVRVRTRMNVVAFAKDGDAFMSGADRPGGSKGLEFWSEDRTPESVGEEAARIALVMVKAKDCPSGKMPVVIDNEFGGVIFHEACGHALEATSVAKNQSVFAGKLGQQIAAPCVSAVDDGTIENAWGSENIDDEGTPQQKRVLIENGILKSYMIDKLNARRMGMEPTGSGRRQSYKFEPTSRMSNTFICAGKDKFEDLFVGIEKGLYAKKMGGGSVNPMTGEFNFAVNEGYMIENGKITYPVKGASLIGNGRDILMNIDKVASNLGRGQGMCGSASGSIPTDVGQPAIRVTSITVGGTANE